MIVARGWTAAYMPSFFMRSRCAAVSCSPWMSAQRRFLIGNSLLICFDLVEESVERVASSVVCDVQRQPAFATSRAMRPHCSKSSGGCVAFGATMLSLAGP